MHAEYFTIDANDLPLDLFRQLTTAYPQKDAEIYLDESYEGEIYVAAVFYGDKVLNPSDRERMELLSMYNDYKREQAEV